MSSEGRDNQIVIEYSPGAVKVFSILQTKKIKIDWSL